MTLAKPMQFHLLSKCFSKDFRQIWIFYPWNRPLVDFEESLQDVQTFDKLFCINEPECVYEFVKTDYLMSNIKMITCYDAKQFSTVDEGLDTD